MLTENEQDRVRRYKSEKMRRQALFVRYKLRKTLSEYCLQIGSDFIAPDEWLFETEKYGKPKLIDSQFKATGIQFNISHSGDYLVIGVFHSEFDYSDILFGVDIERERKNTAINAILNRYFSRVEVSQLLDLPEDMQRKRFFDLWALKESYIKATGRGLATKLDSFSFEYLNDDIKLIPEFQYKDKKWVTILKQTTENYRIALSIATNQETDVIFCYETLN